MKKESQPALNCAAICADYEHMTIRELSKKYGVGIAVIRRVMREGKVHFRARGVCTDREFEYGRSGEVLKMQCLRCRQLLPATAYYPDHGTKCGLHSVCKECLRWRSREEKYGITREVYEAMLEAQNGCCKICGGQDSCEFQDFVVDHNHKTGTVRGLLCSRCNHALGHAKDAPELLLKMACYVGWDGSARPVV